MQVTPHLRRIRSYACREKRLTPFQIALWQREWPCYGLSNSGSASFDFNQVFGRVAPRVLEIGFGDGQSLLEMAEAAPEMDFIGVEVYERGIVSLLASVSAAKLKNLRIIFGDAAEILADSIPTASLDRVQIFFADPWPKTRHHKRRLIQPAFASLLSEKLKPEGVLHLATDWLQYAQHMMRVLSQNETFCNLAGTSQFAARPSYRPFTKYEKQALAAGCCIYDLQFQKLFKNHTLLAAR